MLRSVPAADFNSRSGSVYHGATIQLNQAGGSGGLFAAGVSSKAEGFAKVVSKGGGTVNLGANDNGIVSVRVSNKDGEPGSAGISVQPDSRC